MRRLLAFATIAIATFSCRSLPFPDPHYEGEYGKALKKWTRQTTLYNGLETRAFVRAVFMSEEFVTAQAAEISRMRAELPDKAAETMARLHEEYAPPTVFAVVYVPDPNANDWDLPDSVWRLALNVGLGERAPDRVERFDRPFNAELKALYPYLDEYSIAYRIHFPDPNAPAQDSNATAATQPAVPAPEHFKPTDATFIAAGAPGHMTFHWALDGREETGSGTTSGPGPKLEPPPSPKPP